MSGRLCAMQAGRQPLPLNAPPAAAGAASLSGPPPGPPRTYRTSPARGGAVYVGGCEYIKSGHAAPHAPGGGCWPSYRVGTAQRSRLRLAGRRCRRHAAHAPLADGKGGAVLGAGQLIKLWVRASVLALGPLAGGGPKDRVVRLRAQKRGHCRRQGRMGSGQVTRAIGRGKRQSPGTTQPTLPTTWAMPPPASRAPLRETAETAGTRFTTDPAATGSVAIGRAERAGGRTEDRAVSPRGVTTALDGAQPDVVAVLDRPAVAPVVEINHLSAVTGGPAAAAAAIEAVSLLSGTA